MNLISHRCRGSSTEQKTVGVREQDENMETDTVSVDKTDT